MARIVALLLAVIVAWLGLVDPASAVVPQVGSTFATYTYDDHGHTAASATTPERGPPAAYDRVTNYGAIDRWSHGAFTRLDSAAPGSTTTYTFPTRFVRVAHATCTTLGSVRPGAAQLSSLAWSDGAAETAPEVASGLDRTGTALSKSDAFHRSASWVVDNPAAKQFAIKGGDGVSRELYQLPGEVNGKSGIFEWIIDRSGSNPVINHQRFIPGGSVTGYPNQVVP